MSAQLRRYRKKPVVIEAMQYHGGNGHDIADWLGDNVVTVGATTLRISTLEGPHTASRGDFIIKGIAGEAYPVKPSIFADTYDLVEDE